MKITKTSMLIGILLCVTGSQGAISQSPNAEDDSNEKDFDRFKMKPLDGSQSPAVGITSRCSSFIHLSTHTELRNKCNYWVRVRIWYPAYNQKIWYHNESTYDRRGKFSISNLDARIVDETSWAVEGGLGDKRCLKIERYNIRGPQGVWRAENSCAGYVVTRVKWFQSDGSYYGYSDFLAPPGTRDRIMSDFDNDKLTYELVIAEQDPP